MKISLEQMTVKSPKVLRYLVSYLEKVKGYDKFDPHDMLNVFVSDDGDFTAFEAQDYNLQFTSSAHKLSETIQSSCVIDPVSFAKFFVRIEQIAREAEV